MFSEGSYSSLSFTFELVDGISFTLANVKLEEICSIKAQVADVMSAQDYMPFGSIMPGRKFSSDYRYGFNGKEQDEEIKNVDGSSLDFGARMYDPRIGRWMSMDAKSGKFPGHSPYVFVINSPISFIDPDGNEIDWANSVGAKEYMNAIRSTEIGRKIWKEMVKSHTVIKIIYTNDVVVQKNGGYSVPLSGLTVPFGEVNNPGNEAYYDQATVYISLETQKVRQQLEEQYGANWQENLTADEQAKAFEKAVSDLGLNISELNAESTDLTPTNIDQVDFNIVNPKDEYAVSVTTPLPDETQEEYENRITVHEGAHTVDDAKYIAPTNEGKPGNKEKTERKQERNAYYKEGITIRQQQQSRKK